jgi:hypothetical protein
MQIIVKTLTASLFVMDVLPSDTIDNVKAKIQDEWDTPPQLQSLIFNNIRVSDGTLSDYNIAEFDTINLITPEVDGLE